MVWCALRSSCLNYATHAILRGPSRLDPLRMMFANIVDDDLAKLFSRDVSSTAVVGIGTETYGSQPRQWALYEQVLFGAACP